MKTIILRECTDHSIIYGAITVNVDVNVVELQDKIYEIKNDFYKSDIYDWTLEEVLEELSKTYDFTYSELYECLEV